MPIALALIPLTAIILWFSFKPEIKNLKENPGTIKSGFRSQDSTPLKVGATLVMFILTIVAWVFFGNKYGIGQISMMTATLYLIFGLAKWKEYNDNVNWQVVWLYAASLSMGECLINTGAANWLAIHLVEGVQSGFGITGGVFLIAVIGLISLLLTNTMAAGPAIAAIGPVILKVGELAHMNPIVVGLSTAIFTSFGFVLMVGHPSSLIVYGSGLLTPKDFLKGGPLLSLIALLFVTFVGVGVYWKFLGL